MRVHFASDHAGFGLKQKLIEFVNSLGYETVDHGPYEFDPDDDYPDYIAPAARAVAENPEQNRGIILGKSGQGEAMVTNRFKGVRAAVFYGGEKRDDIIKLTREHNDANVFSIAAGFVDEEEAKEAVKKFLETDFSGEERHIRRIKKIDSSSHT